MVGGWGRRYCEPCAKALRFQVVDRLTWDFTHRLPEQPITLASRAEAIRELWDTYPDGVSEGE